MISGSGPIPHFKLTTKQRQVELSVPADDQFVIFRNSVVISKPEFSTQAVIFEEDFVRSEAVIFNIPVVRYVKPLNKSLCNI